MSGLSFTAVSSHSILPQTPSTSQNIQKHKPASFLRRALGNGLFFLILVLLPAHALPADVTLAWDPNTEPDLEGYGVYFKKDAPGPPYDLFGNVALTELTDPDNPTFTLSGLQKGSQYYITLTAYDTAGNESGYADPVCAEIGDQIVPCASAVTGTGDGGTTSGGGSGGGAGCFIATSLDRPQPYATIFALCILGALFFLWPGMFARKKVFNQ